MPERLSRGAFRLGPIAALVWGIACSSGSGPAVPTTTHPSGDVFATPSLAGEPYGVAVSASGDVLVAQVTGGTVTSFRLPDTTAVASVRSIRSRPRVRPDGGTPIVTDEDGRVICIH
jgi:hypothetical protein